MAEKKSVEIICVGSQILLGNTVNTNAAFLAGECEKNGLSCVFQTVVGNDGEKLLTALETAVGRVDIVLVSGAMGSSPDDVTKGVCETLTGEKSIEPGYIISYKGKYLVLLPGAPVKMEQMFKERVVPFLQTVSEVVFLSQTVKLVGETVVSAEEKIADIVGSSSNPIVTAYDHNGEVHIRVIASGSDTSECEKIIKPLVRRLINLFGNSVYTTKDDVSLEKAVVDLLLSGGLRVQTVESCTGGMIAARIVNVPGASEVFKSGLVTYSNKAKRKLAGVKKSTIEKYTAVSAETASEMVKGTDIGPKADVIVGVTGYADAGDDNSPAGLVYIACNVCGKITVKEYHFDGNRAKVRESATTGALVLMRECILSYLSEKTFNDGK